MLLIPYVEINGARTFTDEEIKTFFQMMIDEGTAKKVFHQGSVSTPDQFLQYLKKPSNHTIIIIDENRQPMGISWINGIEDRRAWFSFNVFKPYWGKKSIEILCLAREHWMNMENQTGQQIIKILIGITPSNNRLAIRMMQKCGATSLPEIPDFMTNHWTGERHGGVLSYFRRK